MRALATVLTSAVIATCVFADEPDVSPSAEPFFFSSIPLTVEEGAMEREKPRVLINVSKYKGSDLGELGARHKDCVVKDGKIEIAGLGYPVSADKVARQHRRPSFVIDYDEEVFADIAKDIKKKHGPKPTAKQLTEYVDEFIDKKGYGRGFDIASKVAAKKEGDCSEHAVLLAAILRLYKFPARVVFGVVIVEAEGVKMAVGHAWVEYHQNKKWHLADSALIKSEGEEHAFSVLGYIPVRVQKDEGPGYGTEMITGLSLLHVEGVEIK